MKYLLIFSFLCLLSCGYPDIDSMPDFKNLTITKEEAIDLCKMNNTDKQLILDCVKKIRTQE